MSVSKIKLENEVDIGFLPLHKTPVLTPQEEMFFALHYGSWIVVQLWIKRKLGVEKFGREEFKRLSELKNKKRARDRYFLHKFIPEEMFEGMEIQHFWEGGMRDKYEYCCIWTRYENQVIELRKLKKMGWHVERMAYEFEEAMNNGKDER